MSFLSQYCYFMIHIDHNIGLLEKRHFFAENLQILPKIKIATQIPFPAFSPQVYT
jgi:hypothetical protein